MLLEWGTIIAFENELFFYPKTRMLFGDAKATLQKLTAEVKEV